MNSNFWTQKEENLLRKWYGKKPLEKIASRLKRTPAAIKSRAGVLKLGHRHYWTRQEISKLRKLYKNHTLAYCAKKLGHGISSIFLKTKQHKIKHSKKFQTKLQEFYKKNIEKAGLPYRYKKGHQGSYKFPKGFHCSRKTEFKKGHLPANTLYNGAIRVHLEKTGHTGKKRLMKFIRIKKNEWEYLKNHNWKKQYGKVPKGMMVAFKNPKDPMKCSIRNLCLITKAESARRTQMTDEWMAQLLAHIKGVRGKYDRELAKDIIKHYPGLIRLKRKELQLRRKIRNAEIK